MNYQSALYWLGAAAVNGFGMWLAIRLADPDNGRNTFFKSFLINLCLAVFAYSSMGGMFLVLAIIGILAYTLYDMELGQAVGVVLLMLVYLMIIGGIYLLVNRVFPSTP